MNEYTGVNAVLAEWGRWVCRQNDMGLGWPREVPFNRERVSGSRSTETYIEATPPNIARVDIIVRRMLPREHRIVIVAHYTGHGPVKDRIVEMHIPRSRYFENLRHAQMIVASLLETADSYVSLPIYA